MISPGGYADIAVYLLPCLLKKAFQHLPETVVCHKAVGNTTSLFGVHKFRILLASHFFKVICPKNGRHGSRFRVTHEISQTGGCYTVLRLN
ncbi:hypothetical protein CEXT_727551 [Caerostris extrusa]|uniref:Uncharacterized protein n=1 Tax=Caerostris extrusa TaxID=172846 RepID=A0AAV4PJW0_CAEEX|nr:hypothetical protein CEXT_727551 [Caerostris extrusa]